MQTIQDIEQKILDNLDEQTLFKLRNDLNISLRYVRSTEMTSDGRNFRQLIIDQESRIIREIIRRKGA